MNLMAAVNDASLRLWSHAQASFVTEDPPPVGFGDLTYRHEMSIGGDAVNLGPTAIDLGLPGISLDNLDAIFFYPVMKIIWAIYMFGIVIIAWFADFALGLTWVEWVRTPFETISEMLTTIVSSMNLYAIFLLVTAFVCAIWIARGKWAQGVMELLIAVAIANYAVASIGGATIDNELDTQLSDYSPITLMLGSAPDDEGNQTTKGFLYGARNFGTCMVGQLRAGIDAEDGSNVEMNCGGNVNEASGVTPGGKILETFLWYPVQLVNFGGVLTDECQDVLALVMKSYEMQEAEQFGGDDEPDDAEDWVEGRLDADGISDFENKDASIDALDEDMEYSDEGWIVPGACMSDDEDKYEDAGSFSGLVTQFFLGPSVLLLGIAILVMAFAVLMAGFSAMWQCLKFLFSVLGAILPRGARRPLWMTLASAASSLLVLIFTIVFLGTFLIFIDGLFENSGDGWADRIGTVLLIDVMLVVGVFIFWKGRKSVEQTKDKMAEALGRLAPGGGGGGGGGSAFGGGALGGAAGSLAMSALAGKAFGGGNTMAGIRARELDHKEHLGRLAGLGQPGGPANDFPQVMGGGGKGDRLRAKYERRKAHPGRARAMRIGKGLLGKAALGLATGGSSLLVQGGAAALKSKALKAVTSRTIGRKSKLGNFARRKVVQARNSVKRGVRGKFEQRRQGVVQARINRQYAKHNRKWQADPTSKGTAKAQQKLNKMRTAEPERQDRQRSQDQTARFHDLRAEAKLRHERRQEEKEIAKRQHNRGKWTKLVR